jgi:hypothetical protein
MPAPPDPITTTSLASTLIAASPCSALDFDGRLKFPELVKKSALDGTLTS